MQKKLGYDGGHRVAVQDRARDHEPGSKRPTWPRWRLSLRRPVRILAVLALALAAWPPVGLGCDVSGTARGWEVSGTICYGLEGLDVKAIHGMSEPSNMLIITLGTKRANHLRGLGRLDGAGADLSLQRQGVLQKARTAQENLYFLMLTKWQEHREFAGARTARLEVRDHATGDTVVTFQIRMNATYHK